MGLCLHTRAMLKGSTGMRWRSACINCQVMAAIQTQQQRAHLPARPAASAVLAVQRARTSCALLVPCQQEVVHYLRSCPYAGPA